MVVTIDDELAAEAVRISGNKTADEIVEDAMRFFIAQKQQLSIRDLRGKLHWEGDIEAMRQDKRLYCCQENDGQP